MDIGERQRKLNSWSVQRLTEPDQGLFATKKDLRLYDLYHLVYEPTWLRAAHDRTLLTVADDGPGVPDDALPRLRERFFRAAPAETEGSGMGLAIAQAIATRHGIALQLANRTDGPGFLATLVFPGQVTGDRARAATR